ncbi:heterokaryon incompatibility protein-domain-containing protein [Truncatella angustata]|uniref:Heterokaryon incompatibility protein-domain-containing protein n=1 Tax=Truncatella angustata TaxID=152316 RepID=A0A9P8UER5_9PEZI|nr:heterokaryon incompatibility protein-domain-containing protein [Truncatella angustata]KAH6648584.1 heterokaryon incompatibility protein-domain-containing protein [Truncatella angustata]
MYTSLDPRHAEIRLLGVVPCLEYDAKVSCEITIAQLQNSPPQYAALSYVWGDASITEEILVNGQPFQATKSLASALRQFRESYAGKHGAPSFLWADAVCINQQDLVERAQQVSMMGPIYSKADWVISWLGPFDGSTESAFSLIKACAGHVEGIVKKMGQYPEANIAFMDSELEFLGQNCSFYEQNTERSARNEAWNAVDKLSAHVYWTRIWIVQEVVLAQRPAAIIIHCGRESMTFEQLSDFNLFTERFLQQKPAKPIFFDQRVWDWVIHDSELSLTFINLVQGLRKSVLKDDYRIVSYISTTCRSTDPRDAVFGLYGLTGGEIVPDYTKEVVEVYMDFVAAVLRHRKYKNFFCFAGLIHENQNISVFPSWVPRYHTLKDEGNYAVLPPNAYAKSWLDEKHPEGPTIIGERRIQFSGLRLDRCTRVIRYIGDQQPDPLELMKKFWWTCLEFLKVWGDEHPRNGTRPLENLLSALTRGKDTQSHRLQITPSLQCMTAHAFRILLRTGEPEDDDAFKEKCASFGYATLEEVRTALDDAFVGTGAPEISTLYEVLTPAEYDDACNAFNQMIRLLFKWIGWPLFITTNGRVGLAPPAVADGDIVCLLEGFSIPCLLRGMDQDFVLVGSCYVNGYSDGEPLQHLNDGSLKLEVFHLQ